LALGAALWGSLVTVHAPTASARPDDYRVNLREACRQQVAGAYLNLYDGKIQNEQLAQAASERLAETEQALASARAALAKAEAAYQDKTKAFDVAVAARRDEAAATLENLERQLAQYAVMRDQALAKARAADGEERRARDAITGVFKIERAEDRRDGGYPLRVAYKAECPKFRYLCTLPQADAAALEALAVGGEALEPCRRYAGLSRAGREP
jgi:lysozyme family protein